MIEEIGIPKLSLIFLIAIVGIALFALGPNHILLFKPVEWAFLTLAGVGIAYTLSTALGRFKWPLAGIAWILLVAERFFGIHVPRRRIW